MNNEKPKSHGMIHQPRVKPLTIDKLITAIYDDNFSHIDFIENMGGECDCNIHIVLDTIMKYWTN
jgi:hypothetical protein